jgi:hypothetical protein
LARLPFTSITPLLLIDSFPEACALNAPFKQAERLGRLTTSLGADTLVLLRFDGSDHLNDLFEYRNGCRDLPQGRDRAIDPRAWKKRYGGLLPDEMCRLKQFEE